MCVSLFLNSTYNIIGTPVKGPMDYTGEARRQNPVGLEEGKDTDTS